LAYKSTITIDGRLLKCKFSGERNASASTDNIKMLMREMQSRQLKFILIELNLSGRMLPQETLKSSQKTIQQLKNQDLTIAMVDYNPHSFHDNYLASVFAREENIKLKVFDKLDEANKWLKHQMLIEDE
jgi:hypothetical protein